MSKMQQMVQDIPEELAAFYQETLKAVKQETPVETLQILQLLLTATRALTLTEVRFALVFQQNLYKSEREAMDSPSFVEDDEQMDKLHRALTRGLTETRPQPEIQIGGSRESNRVVVDFVRPLVKDFLVGHDGLALFDDSGTSASDILRDGHYRLVETCINYLQSEEITQACQNLPEADYAGIAKSTEILKKLYESHPFVQYSLLSVFPHIQAAEDDQLAPKDGKHSNLLKRMDTVFPTWRHLYDLHNKSVFHEVHGPETALAHLAAEYGIKAWVNSFLLNGGDVSIKGGRFGTMIEAAAAMGQEEIVDLLIRFGADCQLEAGRFGFPIHAACWKGNQKIVQAILDQGCDVNLLGYEYASPLQAAACSPNETAELVYTLLDANADIHQQGGRHGTVLQAASFKGDFSVVECLVLRGADINAEAGEHGTALGAAAFQGHDKVVNLLLMNGADASVEAGNYGTPIWCAAYNEHSEVIRTLLAHRAGLSPEHIDAEVKMLLRQAAQAKEFYTAVENGDLEQARQFLEGGLDPNVRGGDLSSALHMATVASHTAIVELLVSDPRTNVNLKDSKPRTPLWHAATYGNFDIVKRLLEISNIDVYCKSDTEQNLLWFPAFFGYAEIARMVHQRGVDPHEADVDGNTPYMMAAEEENHGILEIFD